MLTINNWFLHSAYCPDVATHTHAHAHAHTQHNTYAHACTHTHTHNLLLVLASSDIVYHKIDNSFAQLHRSPLRYPYRQPIEAAHVPETLISFTYLFY